MLMLPPYDLKAGRRGTPAPPQTNFHRKLDSSATTNKRNQHHTPQQLRSNVGYLPPSSVTKLLVLSPKDVSVFVSFKTTIKSRLATKHQDAFDRFAFFLQPPRKHFDIRLRVIIEGTLLVTLDIIGPCISFGSTDEEGSSTRPLAGMSYAHLCTAVSWRGEVGGEACP